MRAILPLIVLMSATVAGPLCAQSPAARPRVSAARAQVVRNTLSEWLAPHEIAVPRTLDVDGKQPAYELDVVWQEPGTAGRSLAQAPRGEQARGATGPIEMKVARRPDTGSHMPRLRSLQIAEDRLLAVAVDSGGGLRGVAVIADPRVVRSEWPGADGVLTGRTLRLTRAEFLLPVPDDPTVVAVRLFEPRWNGEAFVMQPIAFVQVPGGGAR